MRILHLLSQKPEATGSGVTVTALIRESARRGHENYLLAGVEEGEAPDLPELPGNACSFVAFSSGELPFSVVGMSDAMPYRSTRFRDLTADDVARYERAFEGRLRAAVEHFRPDVIHSHHLWIMTSLVRCLFPSIPLVVTSHGTDLRQFQLCPAHRERVLAGCASVDGAMVLSAAQREEVVRVYGLSPSSVHVVGIGYDEELFHPGDKGDCGTVRILYAGKLSRAKGVLWLVKALGELHALPWRLSLAGGGGGPEKDEILDAAGAMPERIEVLGPLPQHELARLMGTRHLFVLPSFYEGFPLVVVEALASGCRVVCTDLPAVREILHGRSLGDALTLIAPPSLRDCDVPVAEELPGFVERLRGALRREVKRIAGESVSRISGEAASLLTEFTWSKVFARVEEVYRRVLAR